jgi:hypothetical protein
MSVLPVGFGSQGGYTIENSLRFRASASAYLSRTFGSGGNLKTYTISFWIKRGKLGAQQFAFTGFNGSISGSIQFTSSDTFEFNVDGGVSYRLTTTQVFRDPSAWYHVVCVADTTQATSSNRLKIYVNGVQVTSFGTATYPTLNYDTKFFGAYSHWIGASQIPSLYTDGYLAEFNAIDGQALDPSDFGNYNATTGVWQPVAYAGTYGTNGFYLPFSDATNTTTLVADASGNGNDWTPNNISLTSGVTYDSMTDTPTIYAGGGNYCTANPLITFTSGSPAMALLDGNLNITRGGSGWGMCGSTIAVSTGKWYWEATLVQSGSGDGILGIHKTNTTLYQIVGYSGDPEGYAYGGSGSKYNNTTGTAYGASFTNGDLIGVALDLDAGTLTFYKNNSSQGTAFSSLSGEFYPAFSSDNSTGVGAWLANFGQRPFSYTPPTGFVSLNTYNLPASTIKNGAAYMAATLYTGTGASLTVANTVGSASFQPDFVWVKGRSGATDHALYDSVRGVQKQIESNTITAETTETTGLTAFGSTGFTVGALAQMNTSAATYVAWQWKAGTTSASNTNGSITSTVSAGATQGFSVVTYTGTGANATVGHGLGVAPSMIIVKSRNGTNLGWPVYHSNQNATPQSGNLYLHSTNAFAADSTMWNSTAPTSSVFSIGTSVQVNVSTQTQVAYCFSEVPGYSKFGSYTGNGSTDGPFVYLGFRPAFILTKRSDSTSSWYLRDTSRSPYNAATEQVYPDLSNAEANETGMDILSNGFKQRGTSSGFNASGGTYIYMAFAENPFKNALAR